jgi:hypothetical protein
VPTQPLAPRPSRPYTPHILRAALRQLTLWGGGAQLIKYPNVEDYQRALRQHDEKELTNLRLYANDLRNSAAQLTDALAKNLDRIKRPRSSNAASLY